jgi:hypothetical protein
VTGGTRVLSDWIVVRVTANPGEPILDRMIAMVEGAKRTKTLKEIGAHDLARCANTDFSPGLRDATSAFEFQYRSEWIG